jgi:HAD superfamily hydrolase (TIGR01662 family)
VLAELQKQGKVLHLGLCNTTTAEIKQASRHFSVALIQNELSVLTRKSATDGTLAYAMEQGIPFLAYRPLGGIAKVEKLSSNKTLIPLAEKHHVTPQQIALAAVKLAGDLVIPLMGATQPDHLKQSVAALNIKLDEEDRATLEARFSFAPTKQMKPAVSDISSVGKRKAARGSEVVILMGIQGAGKSELVASYEKQGYLRLNRDDLGGRLDDLVPRMVELLQQGKSRIVLDNTYPTRISREPVISAAIEMGATVRCRFLNTPIHEARVNVVHRMLQRYGRNLGPDEMKNLAKTDNNLPPPAALKKWADSFEMPSEDEGFAQVEVIPFIRRHDEILTNKGLLLDVDGTIRITKSGEKYPRHPDDVELLPGRRDVLEQWIQKGYQLFFVSNQGGVASGKVDQETVDAALQKTIKLLNLPVADVAYCPHPAFPVGCFCRKPFPGLGVYLIQKHHLARKHLVVVGDRKSDEDFATGIGARFIQADEFFQKDYFSLNA